MLKFVAKNVLKNGQLVIFFGQIAIFGKFFGRKNGKIREKMAKWPKKVGLWPFFFEKWAARKPHG